MTPREIDALVAEKVMGWERDGDMWVYNEYDLEGSHWRSLTHTPPFSTKINQAWTVVEEMRNMPEAYELALESQIGKWLATFHSHSNESGGWVDTAPMAICLAALRAVGVPEKGRGK